MDNQNNQTIMRYLGEEEVKSLQNQYHLMPDHTPFDKSWDWLMPVLDKIKEDLSGDVDDYVRFDAMLNGAMVQRDITVAYDVAVKGISMVENLVADTKPIEPKLFRQTWIHEIIIEAEDLEEAKEKCRGINLGRLDQHEYDGDICSHGFMDVYTNLEEEEG